MTVQTDGDKNETQDEFRMYASPIGARFLKKANEIHEHFPISKYLLYFIIFVLEIGVVFWFGMHFFG